MKVDKVLKDVNKFTKRNANTLLSIAGVMGVIGSMVLVGKGTPLAIDRLRQAEMDKNDSLTSLETIVTAAPAYIPAIVVGMSTITCIVSCGIINARRQNQLVAMCNLLSTSYSQYREKVIKMYGEEVDKEIIAEVARSRSDCHLIDCDDPDVKFTWYDPISETFFERFEREIIDAEYHLNRNFALSGYISLNDWYDMLGIPLTKKGTRFGWTIEDGVYWIDFEHRLMQKSNGTTYYSIDALFPPTECFNE